MSLAGLRRFFRSEAGNYAIIFALTIFPILGGISLAVEYSSIERVRSAVQNSLDAAALAAAKEYSKGVTGSTLDAYAQDFVDANLPDYVDPDKVDVTVSIQDEPNTSSSGEDTTLKTVRLDAKINYDSFIANTIGQDQFDIGVTSQVAVGNITVEVALVMDNSGSMGSNRKLQIAKSTAKDLVKTIFEASSNSNKPDPVSFSLVPFSALVNVGTDNADAKWMDTNGWSSIHNENLDWANTYVTSSQFEKSGAGYREKINGNWQWKSRFDIFDMLHVDWEGCVEMRPWPYSTTDDAAVTSSSSDGTSVTVNQYSSQDDLDKLFVPYFAPAEPQNQYAYQSGGHGYGYGYGYGHGYGHGGYGGYGGGGSVNYSNDWYSYYNDYVYDWARPNPSNPSSPEQIYYDTSYPSPYNYGVIQSKQNLRQDWVWRYQAAQLNSSYKHITGHGTNGGPNDGCYTQPITELTTSQNTIDNKINQMQAGGNTNIQQGISWGWRTLSPGEPFTSGRDPSDETNRKYMIVLTDGENTYNTSSTPNETTYAAWGYGKQGRIDQGLTSSDLAGTPYVGDSLNSFEKKMNAHTVQTCNNARAAGVTVFTIAFNVSNGSSSKEMLQACAGSGIVNNQTVMTSGTFYFDVSGNQLEDAMASIADQISELRIVR